MAVRRPGFVYIWYDSLRKMFYIGSHFGPTDDGYICSSRRMNCAYKKRPETFRRRILKLFTDVSYQELLEHEEKWLQLIDTSELGVKYYNYRKETYHWAAGTKTKEIASKISKELSGRKLTDDHVRKISQSLIGNSHAKGKKLTQEHKDKLKKLMTGNTYSLGRKLSQSHIEAIRKANLGNTHTKGRSFIQSDEHKNKISKALKGKPMPPEFAEILRQRCIARNKLGLSKGKPNLKMRGTKFYNNGYQQRMFVPGSEPNDWKRGRLATRT